MKKSPKVELKNVQFKLNNVKDKDLPDYVTVNGVLYERIKSKSTNVDIDLDRKTTNIIKKRMKQFGYVNEAEVIRDAIRRKMFPDA